MSKDGVKFIDCVYPGIKETSSDILLCAGSEDCYSEFGEIFNPYIKDVHGHHANQSKIKSEMNADDMRDTDFKDFNTSMVDGI